jgi:hypothetical protein
VTNRPFRTCSAASARSERVMSDQQARWLERDDLLGLGLGVDRVA